MEERGEIRKGRRGGRGKRLDYDRPLDPRITELRVELAEAGIPRAPTGVLPALQLVQRKLGWIPDWGIRAVSLHVRVAESPVYGAGSGYPELRFTEPADHTIRICNGVPCQVSGSAEIIAAFERATGVRLGEQDEDGRFALEEMSCWAVCALAPVAEVDHRVRGRLAPDQVSALCAELAPSDGSLPS